MNNVLLGSGRDLLFDFAWSRVVVGFDFDGTLAPIVDDPSRAAMRPSTRQLLARVAALYPTAVISGRAQPDVAARVGDGVVRAVIGNHGLEPAGSPGVFEQVVRRWRGVLDDFAAKHPGVEVEDKRFSVAIHYRRSRTKKRVLRDLEAAIAVLQPVRIVGGKEVVNLLPPDAPHKGLALERLQRRLGCDTALYVGDDETDEDVFLMERRLRLLGIRVGRSETSAAPFFLPAQARIDELLGLLVEARESATLRRIAEAQ